MSESPFLTVARIVNEEALFSDTLRIIAKDAKKLSQEDRVTLIASAECLETAHRIIARLELDLSEARQERDAARERVRELAPVVFPTLSASFGGPMVTHMPAGAVK